MSSALAQILRDHKASIAAHLAATSNAGGQSDEDRAMALAKVDSLIGMLQQQPEILTQTLQEMTHRQTQSIETLDRLIADFQAEHLAVAQAVRDAFPEATTAIDTLEQLTELTSTRTKVIIDSLREEVDTQLRETIADQQALRAAVQELSTPIIPLYSGILVLPLVGRIDGSRAQDITEQLLEAIAREQADLVLLDVTGISTVDTSVANHLMLTARAASLLGSKVVVVGLSAEVAQTLVTLGVELGDLVTLSDLQSGVEYALAQLGLAIGPSGRV